MKNIKILIIEDSENDRLIANRILRGGGYRNIFMAETAEEGVNLAGSERFDLALVDIKLPGLDGIRTCVILKERYKVRAVIMVTGLDDSCAKDLSKKYGADDYIVKPIKIEEFNGKLEKIFKKEIDNN